jgi:hypothetical protein
MKTPREWMDEYIPYTRQHGNIAMGLEEFIEAIQRDALNSPFANTTDQEEIDFARERAAIAEYEIKRLNHNVEVYKERWHQARRYLRAANKGAERNNQVMRLQSHDIARLVERVNQLEQTKS